MSSGRRLRWTALVALATSAMVLAASLVLYFRLREYLLKEIDGDLVALAERAASGEDLYALTAGTPITLRMGERIEGHLKGRPPGEVFGYGFRSVTSGPVTATLYLKAFERRMRHHQLLILWTTIGSGVLAWLLAGWASQAWKRESAFSSDVAHELRTPLAALTGEAEVALSTSRSPEEYRAVLASMLEETRRLTGLVNHLLFLSRADAGQEKLTLGEVDVGALGRELQEAFGPLAEEKGLKLVLEVPDLRVRADRIRLRQALANLLDNAVRLTEKGEVRLSAERKGNEVVLSVSDTGPGIPPDLKLFARFSKGPGSSGSGLGLAIVKWVAEAHGGRAEAEGIPGGARFWISIPG